MCFYICNNNIFLVQGQSLCKIIELCHFYPVATCCTSEYSSSNRVNCIGNDGETLIAYALETSNFNGECGYGYFELVSNNANDMSYGTCLYPTFLSNSPLPLTWYGYFQYFQTQCSYQTDIFNVTCIQ